MPPGGPDDADEVRRRQRQLRDNEQLGTALERSYSQAKIAAINMLDKIRSEGDETFDVLRDQIVNSVTDGGQVAADNLLDSLTEAVSRAPKELRKYFDEIAAMAAKSADPTAGSHAQYRRAKGATASVVNGQMGMISSARSAAVGAGLTGAAREAFVGHMVYGSQTAGSLVDIDAKMAAAKLSLSGAGEEAALEAALAGLSARKKNIIGQELRSKAEQISHETAAAKTNASLARAVSKTGGGSEMLRNAMEGKGMFGGFQTSLQGMAKTQDAAAVAGEGVGGMAGLAGRGIEGLAGMLDAIMPLGIALGSIGAIVQLAIRGFDQMRQTGTAAFVALSSKGQTSSYEFAGLNAAIQNATMAQREFARSKWLGTNFDEMNMASLGALTKLSSPVAGRNASEVATNTGMWVDSFNKIQEEGMLAGLSVEESFQIASKAQRSFNLKDGPATLHFFERLTGLAHYAGLNMRDFSAGLGDTAALAVRFGDKIGESFSAMAATMAHITGGSSDRQLAAMGVAGAIARTPFETKLALHMGANPGMSSERSAEFLESGKMGPGQILADAMSIFHSSGARGEGTGAMLRVQMNEFLKGSGVFGQEQLEFLESNISLMGQIQSGKLSGIGADAAIQKALMNGPKNAETALEAMNGTEQLLAQLVGLAEGFIQWITSWAGGHFGDPKLLDNLNKIDKKPLANSRGQ